VNWEKKMKENYGFKVKIKYAKASAYVRNGCNEQTFRNVTEIHYCFSSPFGKQTTFESDIQRTGCTIFNNDIKEFEAKIEKEKAKDF
jgi:hypothetical protein